MKTVAFITAPNGSSHTITELRCNPLLILTLNTLTLMVSIGSFKSRIEELGLTLDTLGKFIIVTQCSSQSEEYGLRYQDRLIRIRDTNCVGRDPNEVVNLIRQYMSNPNVSIDTTTMALSSHSSAPSNRKKWRVSTSL